MRLDKVLPKFAVPLLILLCAAHSSALEVSGVVVDENGKPLAGVRVAAGEARSVPELTKPVEGVTDPSGEFVIKDIPDPVDSPYLGVEAYAPGRVPASDMVKVGTPKKVKLALKPARSVAIQLLELNGKPASKVKITGAEFTFPSLWGLITETGPDGKIAIPYAPEKGSLTLSVADSRYVHSDIQLRIPEDNGAKFRVIPGGVIEGTLLDAAGKPISGASVSARANTLGFWGGYGGAVTDDSGKFRISRLDSEDFVLYVSPKDAYAAEPMKCKVTRGKVTKLPIIKAPTPGRIEGVVLDDETGKPVPNAEISFEPAVWSSGWGGESVSSDKDGRFVILAVGRLHADPYLYSSSEYPYEANSDLGQDFALKPGQVKKWEVRLRKTVPPELAQRYGPHEPLALKPAEKLSVIALDERNCPVAGCDLRLLRYDEKDGLSTEALATAKTDGEGTAFVSPPEGTTFVWVASKKGFCNAWNATSRFVADPVVLRMFPEQPIRGQVVTEAGKALPNARVTAKSATAGYYYGGAQMGNCKVELPTLMGGAPTCVTDAKGEFVLKGIPMNQAVSIELSQPGFLKTAPAVAVPNASAKVIALKPTALRGQIAPMYPSLAKVPLAVKVKWMGDFETEQTAPVNADGSFVVPGVPSASAMRSYAIYGRGAVVPAPGKPPEGVTLCEAKNIYPYSTVLEVRKPDGRTLSFALPTFAVNAKSVENKGGMTISVKPMVKVTGTMLDKSGKPLANAQVLCQDAESLKQNPNSWHVAETDSSGRWTIYVPVGTLSIAALDNRTFTRTLKFKSAQEAARKDIVIDLSKPAAPENAQPEQVTEYLRVLNPDGVAVPRPRVKADGGPNPLFEQGSGLDGTVAMQAEAGTRVKLVSPYLKKPVYVDLAKDDRWTTISFDYPQTTVPTVTEMASPGIGFG